VRGSPIVPRARATAAALTAAGFLLCGLAGCGELHAGSTAAHTVTTHHTTSQTKSGSSGIHPHAIQPVAGSSASAGSGSSDPSQVSVGPPNGSLPQPLSLTQVRHQLASSGLSANLNQATLAPNGLAFAPVGAPYSVQEIINAGNEIAHLPYRFGGGHGTYEDTAYDCSGSLSFVLAAAGLLHTTVTSGQLMHWGDPGRGKWITIFANLGHTFMYVAGLRFDTVALAESGTRWSNRPADESGLSSFAVRHPPGL
jgi:hypothetical protein